MKTQALKIAGIVVLGLTVMGCASNKPVEGGPERGRDGTIAYVIRVESNEPGAKVEANDEYVGDTPCDIKVFGDPDGTFHNFGSNEYVIRVLPQRPGQVPLKKVFRTGGWFSQEDQIPKRVYFDLNRPQDSEQGLQEKPRY